MVVGARDVALVLLCAALVPFGARAWLVVARGPPALGAPEPAPRCDVPVEVAGAGVACVAPERARAAHVRAGDKLVVTGVGGGGGVGDGGGGGVRRARMAAARLRLWGAPVDVNRATAEELASLDGVGPKLAERIVHARPFRSIADVANVAGIGPRRLERLKRRLVLDE
jgi:competence ComEA-like helix-hairpin-helix protein